jgi:hypothetical protein
MLQTSGSDAHVAADWDSYTPEDRAKLLHAEYIGYEYAVLEDFLGEEGLIEHKIPENWDTLNAEEQATALASEAGIFGEEDDTHEILAYAERLPRTIAFTILAAVQMFHVMAIHTGNNASFFRVFFEGNRLLFWAILSTFILQLIVIYVPFMQTAFKTAALRPEELLFCMILGVTVLFAVEFEKFFLRANTPPTVAA